MATIASEENIDVGRVVQRGFSTIGRNFAGFLLLALLLAGLPNFLMYFLLLDMAPTGGAAASLVGGGLLGLVTAFTAYLLQAALVRSTILDLSGRRVDYQGSLVRALSLFLPMLGLAIVSSIAIGIGLILLVVPGIILYVMWSVAVPVLVEERPGVFESLSRSAELTKGSRWRIFGLLLLFIVFSIIVSAVLGLFEVDSPLESPLLFALGNAVSATVTGLVGAAMLASLYVELKTVKEGASTESLAAIFD